MTTWKEIAQNLIEEDKKEQELAAQQRKQEEERTAHEKFLQNSEELKRRLERINIFPDVRIETIQRHGWGDARAILKAPPDLEFCASLDPSWKETVRLSLPEDLPKCGMLGPYRVSSEIEFARFLLDLDSLQKRIISQREIYKRVVQEVREEVSARIGEDCYSRCSVCDDALRGIQDPRLSWIYPHEYSDGSFELGAFREDEEETIRIWNTFLIARAVSFKAERLEDLPWALTIWKEMRKEEEGFEFSRSYRRLIKPILKRLGAKREPALASALREIEKWEI